MDQTAKKGSLGSTTGHKKAAEVEPRYSLGEHDTCKTCTAVETLSRRHSELLVQSSVYIVGTVATEQLFTPTKFAYYTLI